MMMMSVLTRTDPARVQRVDTEVSKTFKTAASVGTTQIEALRMLGAIVELPTDAFIEVCKRRYHKRLKIIHLKICINRSKAS